ncbi:MAG: hypothetical protein NZ533_11300 [Casimicrobiaceae bacterium]|nr:hypothetical protein [Casimicrobiaceae bacterium]MCX8098852.1 hypothetical protein [Casimicrobiaceae bacterium]MDW8311495.1 hypothetical protein [Burkholderiales bacterium]
MWCVRSFRSGLAVALASGLLAAESFPARASEVIKCIDPATGAIEYTNRAPRQGWQCTRTDGSPLSVIPSGNRPVRSREIASGAGEPPSKVVPTAVRPAAPTQVDSATQRSRDSARRQVLVEELASEEKLLAEARRQLNGGRPMLLPDETEGSPKYLDRIKQLERTVRQHERNVAALKQEIANLRL